ncbi:hypothetical protein F8154_02560 [Alkaliphilus pronyensis]|uniref:Uncharacterized protein n=1 Tax=Alkaliphilus pronyensis TaxID=1482732 RepID=A0A6I0F462_9FIRM|nr:hypothetical protein [Alkaliphilus pronyensis]KAB3537711.1 hypothetical protein F8154_02560 [Alkaliphilus pronyensis]
MDYICIGYFLLWEWLKALVVFSIIDIVLIKKKLLQVLRSHDTYISSLVVASFLVIIRTNDLTLLSFLGWAILSIIFYFVFKILYLLYVKPY